MINGRSLKLGIVTIDQDKKEVNGVLSRVLDLIQSNHQIRILDHEIELG